jgi:5-methylcytosine-specific restriction endonuclease McrA
LAEPKNRHRASAEEIIAAYKATGSVWRAGKELGMAGQVVHDRLRALDYPLANRRWSEDEIAELRRLIEERITLGEIARRLGRPFNGVALKASRLGLRSKAQRARKLPRGAGFDKVSTRRHLTALEKSDKTVTQYARANGKNVDTLVMAFQKHFPDRWAEYVAATSGLPRKTCPYCERQFVPANGKQRFCTRKCGEDARRDQAYFGGKRRDTIGLAEGICQLCGREEVKGLSSHHIFGKENDPENEALIALCPGCHKVITLLATRTFQNNETAWETLIGLSWARHFGGDLPADEVHVCVDLDLVSDET